MQYRMGGRLKRADMAKVVLINTAKPDDPVATAYKWIRDAALSEDLPSGMAIAILEMVKAEIIRDQQAQIDMEVE